MTTNDAERLERLRQIDSLMMRVITAQAALIDKYLSILAEREGPDALSATSCDRP